MGLRDSTRMRGVAAGPPYDERRTAQEWDFRRAATAEEGNTSLRVCRSAAVAPTLGQRPRRSAHEIFRE